MKDTTVKVTLEGAIGSGKSTLLGEFTRFLERNGCKVQRHPDADLGMPAESATVTVPANFAEKLRQRRQEQRAARQQRFAETA